MVSLQPWPDVYDMTCSTPCAAQTAAVIMDHDIRSVSRGVNRTRDDSIASDF